MDPKPARAGPIRPRRQARRIIVGREALRASSPSASPPGIERAMIKGLHHNAYRCRDSEETRRFYEDFLGLPLACTLNIGETKSGRRTTTLHTFYELDDGSYLAFFEAPDMPFEFKHQ